VREVASADHDIALWLAEILAMEGFAEESLEWVRRAVSIGNENYPLIAHTPKLAALRDDVRFTALLEELRARWEARMKPEQAA
jgi:serine/threonine-protein kinase